MNMHTSIKTPVTEAELKATTIAVRVTDADVEAFIDSEHVFTAADGVFGKGVPDDMVAIPPNLGLMTICILVLKNGFTVQGLSACADPLNFDAGIGARYARANAKEKVWELLGYDLHTRLSLVGQGTAPSFGSLSSYVGTKAVHAKPMTRLEWVTFRRWELPKDENGTDEGYLVEYADGGPGNIPGFTGYVSWSPKDVFERSYQLIKGPSQPTRQVL